LHRGGGADRGGAATSRSRGPPAAPSTESEPAIAEVIEAIAEPVLVIADNRVEAANQGARELLGQHMLGEDVRVAIRHPAAAERLDAHRPGAPAAPIHLVGLGTRDQRWEMRVHTLGDGRASSI
jgi:two-component system phosphate regulon sensor histidine kinase PhoR